MYAGRIVELGPADELFESSAHPYTRRLVGAIPRLAGGRSLVGIPGHAPSPGKRPHGCSFAPRCALRIDECEVAMPEPVEVQPGHTARCIKAHEVVKYQQTEYGDPVALPEPDSDKPVLTIDNVVGFYGSTEVLHSINMTLEQGRDPGRRR